MFCVFFAKKNRKWKPAVLETSFTKHLSQSGGLDSCFSSQFLGCWFLLFKQRKQRKKHKKTMQLFFTFKRFHKKWIHKKVHLRDFHPWGSPWWQGFHTAKNGPTKFHSDLEGNFGFLPLHFHPNLRAWRARAAPEFSGRPNGLKNGYSNRRADLEDIQLSCLMDNDNEIGYQSWWFFC